jgi:hypothetical protein
MKEGRDESAGAAGSLRWPLPSSDSREACSDLNGAAETPAGKKVRNGSF